MEQKPEGGRFERMGRKMDERFGGKIPRLEDEVRRMISYLDDQVVPILRRNSSIGLRAAAERLRLLAERLERAQAEDARAADDHGEDRGSSDEETEPDERTRG